VTAPALVPAQLRGREGYPSFSPEEMARRRTALLQAAAAEQIDVVVVVGAERSGSGVQWVTGWPVTREAMAVLDGSDDDVMFVQHYNHVPLARQLAPRTRVQWGGPSTVESLVAELRRRGARSVALVGPVSSTLQRGLDDAAVATVDLNRAYTRLRLTKSVEELAWLRVGAAMSDAAIDALREHARPGMTEWQLVDVVERAYVPHGGTTHIHYFSVTPMADPQRPVPAQYPSYREVRAGDALVVELSAAFWGYPGQVLRTFAVAAEPSPLYAELHAAADAAFDAIVGVLRDGTTADEIMDAAHVIEEAGFTTLDDLVHGFGGGYLPPVLGSRSRNHDRRRAIPVRAGMTVVVQPNVVTRDGRAGVQTGELVHVTSDGPRRLHTAQRGFLRAG
jgi:Xaa-Pro dipeptidase